MVAFLVCILKVNLQKIYTMKTLVLIRHGKSSWKDKELKDLERPLKKRCLSDASLISKVLKDIQITPEQIITSPAARALETAKVIASEYNIDTTQIVTESGLYLESKGKLMKEINKINEQFNTVFLISHNPGLTDLANALTGESVKNIPTCGALAIQFESGTWAEVDKGKGKKLFFEVPKTHRKKFEKNEKPVLQS